MGLVNINDLLRRMEAYELPTYMADGVYNYINHGMAPGSFLSAVIKNNLMDATILADGNNVHKLAEWAMFMREVFPPKSWGAASSFIMWTNCGGLQGGGCT